MTCRGWTWCRAPCWASWPAGRPARASGCWHRRGPARRGGSTTPGSPASSSGPCPPRHRRSCWPAATRPCRRAWPRARSAVVPLPPADERRAAHGVLAARRRDAPARHAWHLAEAATGPDERVAALLHEVALATMYRGDAVGAITGLLRAADLSPAGRDR